MEIFKPRNRNSFGNSMPASPFSDRKIFVGTVVLVATVFFFVGGGAQAKRKSAPGGSAKKAWLVVQEALTSEDSVLRETAVQSLEFVQSEQADNSLLSSLKDDSEYVQIWAARSL